MASASITTVVKMLEVLPESAQDDIVEHLRKYISEKQDDLRWTRSFKRTQGPLVVAARRAKEEIAAGKASPMDYDRL
jgi:hypothetical protein